MLDFASRLGRRVARRLRRERIVWLVTTDARNTPQPRPVWFHWDGRTVLVFSERTTAKVRHIARNPRVALHFNTDESGGNVAVLIGEARILRRRPPAARVRRYLRKYRQGLKDIGMTAAQFSTSFVVPILITPKAMRGF
ncbi:MAG: TIGR03667 family PPOX class F420-dependent oxidoreductase [Armatimonadota bacterium]|nr:TIGR03667 family PPOX class F420-dependent oxidoreductase [Armatimonadota bacterium]